MLQSKKIGLILGPLLFALCKTFFHPEGLTPEANSVLATTLWMAAWWITEAIPISVTALLPMVLFPLTNGLDIGTTAAAYGHKYIFLYMGGFILAIAIENWNLHRRIALNTIRVIGSNQSLIVLGFMLATAGLSMWISNTATSVMMLPIAMAVISQLRDNPLTQENETQIFGKALMLAIAYSASIGGMATKIGTPPNLVLLGTIEEMYGIEVSFYEWFRVGFPISIFLLGICWWYLTQIAFKMKDQSFPGGVKEILRLLKEMGKMKYEEKIVLSVFVGTALLWIFRSYFQTFFPKLDDSVIAMMSSITLFLLPNKSRDRALITWEEAVKMPWGIILLFGGGMALAAGFKTSGLANWIGSQLSLLQGLEIFLTVLILVAAVNFLTEITSNLATTAMLLPILGGMALALDIHPFYLMISATLAASCAFMLPVATPPNAVVFGSGYLRIPDMVKNGIWMNLISILIISVFTYFLLPLLWDLSVSP
ncbi:MAG: SLC13 family permease [Bacteroidota bacterium]